MAGFDELFRALRSIPNQVDAASKRGLKRGAAIVAGKAKSKLGTYQSGFGPYPAWAKLRPETVRRKHMSVKGGLTRAGKKYLKKHGSWGAGGNDDSPLVNTGLLRQAITTDDSQLNSNGVMYVGVAAGKDGKGKGSPGDYAAAHEFGYAPKNIPPRPFLRPALHESQEAIKDAVAKELQKELRRL